MRILKSTLIAALISILVPFEDNLAFVKTGRPEIEFG